jgi:Ca2+/H+ antiporter, TMEM165/GDT1 family
MNIEELGLIGIFIAGAIPWMEAIAVVPTGVILGLDPIATVIAAVLGNAITIFIFAYLVSTIRAKIVERRVAKGKTAESPKFEKALMAFDRYGIYGMAFLGPIIIGTQFAAAASVAAGVRPLRVSILITSSMILWASGIAAAMVVFDLSFELI